MIKEAIAKVVRGQDLTEMEMESAMNEIMTGRATSAQIGALATGLRIKGETVQEITGAARAVQAGTPKIGVNHRLVNLDRDEINVEEETILDACGTGGDGTQTFNVSTATAFVAAGAGVKVVKHGNRAFSTLCGGADVLENLGVNPNLTTADVERSIGEIGIGFLYAPLFEGAMRHAAAARREIGIRTIFNLVGPLANPAGAAAQVLGVYDLSLTKKMALTLKALGCREAFVVCGQGALDEISICGPTTISHLKEGSVETFSMRPEEYGFQTAAPQDIMGGNTKQNARIVRDILAGKRGSKRDMVLLNAAAAFVAAGLDKDFHDGIRRAEKSIDSGAATEKLERLVEFTRECRPFVRKEIQPEEWLQDMSMA